MHGAYICGRSENNIKCVVHNDLGRKNWTTRYILPRHWLYEWFSQFHSCGTCSVLSWSPSVYWSVGSEPCQRLQLVSSCEAWSHQDDQDPSSATWSRVILALCSSPLVRRAGLGILWHWQWRSSSQIITINSTQPSCLQAFQLPNRVWELGIMLLGRVTKLSIRYCWNTSPLRYGIASTLSGWLLEIHCLLV